MTKCPNCGSVHCFVYNISCETNEDHTAIIGQVRRYTCNNCNCHFEEKYENGETTVKVFTELDTDRDFEVVLGTRVSSRMNEKEAIRQMNKMRKFFPDKNIYYRFARK